MDTTRATLAAGSVATSSTAIGVPMVETFEADTKAAGRQTYVLRSNKPTYDDENSDEGSPHMRMKESRLKKSSQRLCGGGGDKCFPWDM
jgi:hypothetical protein